MKKELELEKGPQGGHTPGLIKSNTQEITKLENTWPLWHTLFLIEKNSCPSMAGFGFGFYV